MKLTFFDFNILSGGGTQGTLYLLERLKNEGININIVDAYGCNDDYLKSINKIGLPLTILDENIKNQFIGANNQPLKRLFKTIKQIPDFSKILYYLYKTFRIKTPEIILVNNEKSLLFIGLLKSIFRYKIVLYYRGESTVAQISTRFVKINNIFTDKVIAHSKISYQNLILRGFKKDHLHEVHNCIELDKFNEIKPSTDLPLKKTKFRLMLCGGRIVKEKGYHTGIKALSHLVQQGCDVDLLLPGYIETFEGDEYLQSLKKIIKENSLESRVHFIGWRNYFIGDLVQCDIAILPSYTEGFPRAVIEAMVQGVPVCATPVGGVPEAIEHGKTGLLFDIDNDEQLALCIQKLLDNPSLYQKIKQNSQVFARDYFHPSHNTKSITKILEELNRK